MTSATELVAGLDRHGFSVYTGVPCSYFSAPIAKLTQQGRYLPAANEGAALALAAGAAATGARAAAFAQNSGFGNLLNPLTSLLMPYDLALLVLMSLRGWPDPDGDEPQHRVMGATTHRLLDTLGVRHWTLRGAAAEVDEVLGSAVAEMEQGRPAFILVPKGAISADEAAGDRLCQRRRAGLPSRSEGIRMVLDGLPDALVVSTTGYASRELFALADCERFFYMQGSMGHASAFGLGVTLTAAGSRRVVVLDGDGAALMHMGSMTMVGAVAPPNLVHVIFDNGTYESTGGQPTSSASTSFLGVGRAAGYRTAVGCSSAGEVLDAVEQAASAKGPHLIVIETAPGNGAAPPRATSAISAPEIRSRFAAAAGAAAR